MAGVLLHKEYFSTDGVTLAILYKLVVVVVDWWEVVEERQHKRRSFGPRYCNNGETLKVGRGALKVCRSFSVVEVMNPFPLITAITPPCFALLDCLFADVCVSFHHDRVGPWPVDLHHHTRTRATSAFSIHLSLFCRGQNLTSPFPHVRPSTYYLTYEISSTYLLLCTILHTLHVHSRPTKTCIQKHKQQLLMCLSFLIFYISQITLIYCSRVLPRPFITPASKLPYARVHFPNVHTLIAVRVS